MQPIAINMPYYHLLIDEIDLGLTKNGNRYAICIIDLFSKYAFVRPTATKEATPVADFIQWLIQKHGRFVKLHSDNGSEFMNSQVFKVLEEHQIRMIYFYFWFCYKISFICDTPS